MPAPFTESHSYPSYSQAGEDRILFYLFDALGSVHNLTYADLGAAAPAGHNNTYIFYTLGGSGVLVEPDPTYYPAYQELRPRDRVDQVAVVPERLRNKNVVEFHAMENPGWSSICPDHINVAKGLSKGAVRQTYRVPCLTVNEILEDHFNGESLDILSIDIEGVEKEVLMEIDFRRFRPKAIVVEASLNTADGELGAVDQETKMRGAGYVLFACTFVNNIYLQGDLLSKIKV